VSLGIYDLYRDRTTCAISKADNKRNDIQQELINTFVDSPAYHKVVINDEEFESHAHILYDRKLDYYGDPNIQQIIMHPDYSIKAGDYVYVTEWDNVWIVPNVEGNKDIYEKGIIVICGNTWKWKDENNVIHSYPCAIYDQFSTQSALVQKRNIIVPSGNLVAFVQYNDYTKTIDLEQRMLFKDQAWRINKIQNIQQDGMILFFLNKDVIQSDDDFENGIASNDKYNYSLNILQNDFEQSIGYTSQLTAELLLNGIAQTRDLIWISSNQNIVSVDTDGNISCLANGVANIKVYLKENPDIYDEITINIVDVPLTAEIRISSEDFNIKQGRAVEYQVYRYVNNVAQIDAFTYEVLANTIPSNYYEIEQINSNTFNISCITQTTEPLVVRFRSVENATEYLDVRFALVGLW
jgi:hypothetical protein